MIYIVIIVVVIIFILAMGGPDTRTQEQKDYEEGYKAGMFGGPYNPDDENYLNGFIDGENDRDNMD